MRPPGRWRCAFQRATVARGDQSRFAPSKLMSSTPGTRAAENFAKTDTWRRHPLLRTTLSSAVPGFRLGLGAFLVYVACEKAFEAASGGKKDAHGHGHGHGHDAKHGGGGKH